MMTHSKQRLTAYTTAPEGFQALMGFARYGLEQPSIDEKLAALIELRASQINGCAFCAVMHTNDACDAGETDARLAALPVWRDTPSALVERFVRALESRDEAQLRAFLTEDVTHVGDGGGVVPASGTRPIIGRERVAMLLLALHAKYAPRLELADIGGSPGLIIRGEGGAPQGVIALATDGEFIANIHVVVNPHKVANIFKTTQGPFTRTS